MRLDRDGGHLRLSVLTMSLGAVVALVALVVGTILFDFPVAALGFVGVVVFALMANRFGIQQCLFVLAFSLLPLNGVRVGSLAIADPVIALALVFALPNLRKLGVPGKYAAPLYILVLSSLLASVFSPAVGAALGSWLRLTVASVVCVLLIFFTAPTGRLLRASIWAFAIGNAVSVVSAVVSRPEYSDRLNGLATHANSFGLIGTFAAILLWGVLPSSNALHRVCWTVLEITAIAAVVLSGSRACLIAVFIGVVASVCNARKPLRAAVLLVTVGALVILPLAVWQSSIPGSAVQRLFDPQAVEDQSNTGRLEHAEYAIERWSASPILGGGMDIGVIAHNVYLQLLTAAGPAALVAFLVIVGAILRSLWRRKELSVSAFNTSSVLFSALMAYVVAAALSNNLWDRFVWILLGLGMYVGSTVDIKASIRNPKPELVAAR